ncbi:PepSY-associated TM helix domain-containing protein [Alteriqipengyuania lutimaris]|uniref:PepSY domain-containing protein n=1 Tax=Alteriqipengyuania lutimaris TaxID=1538146 RepID=A0A395LPP8_9SPHN|nr:PepSY-associated TM helix domain-containing protein [Alteriqipengyuania lutimaris]MBB3032442.1 putative iron-regulated membrane protein [Alteriqipengyuania lutimaris]RDS78417.1 PepSY domain-containing protein [Alteriqipengyuania lutimaris]
MTVAFSKDTVRKAISAHSALGLVCCALLYLICATGTAIVLYEEWQRLEQRDAPEMTEIAPADVQRGIENVLASESDGPATTHLYVHLPTEALPRTTITTDTQAVHIDAQGQIAKPEENAWAEFLLALHYRLNLPAMIGMSLVGMFGAMLVALAISGIVAHPRIFRDAFRLRARRGDDVATLDWHNRLAVWTLPFALAIALTGSMIGLFYISGSGLAMSAYGGDSAAALAPVFGSEPEGDASPGPVPDARTALAFMEREYPEVLPYYVILHDPGTPGQHMQIVGEHPRRLIFGEYYAFSGDGEFHGTVGMADGTVGQQLAASTYNLHFGNFGGLPVKIAYILFGLAMTVVVATGTFVWFDKRERSGKPATYLRASWWGLVIGVPAGLIATLAARLALGNAAPFVAIFWAVCVLTMAAWMLRARRQRTSGIMPSHPVPAE